MLATTSGPSRKERATSELESTRFYFINFFLKLPGIACLNFTQELVFEYFCNHLALKLYIESSKNVLFHSVAAMSKKFI